jgi:hypothetical protein
MVPAPCWLVPALRCWLPPRSLSKMLRCVGALRHQGTSKHGLLMHRAAGPDERHLPALCAVDGACR